MFNAIKFFNDYGITYYETGKNVSPGWVNIRCIFCGDDSNHMGWNLVDEYIHCWKCGVHKIDYTISRLLKISISESKNIISNYREYISSKKIEQSNVEKLESIPGSQLNKFHRQYLINRGFDPDYLVEKYKITGTDINEIWEGIDFQLRIIVPIFYNGSIVSFQGRDITNKQKERYKACPKEKSVINMKNIFYKIDSAIKFSTIIIVEGIMDAWKIDMDNVVCSFGTSMTSSQLRILSSFKKICFLFDSEPEAQMKASKYAAQLAVLGKSVEVLELENAKDADLLSNSDLKLLKMRLENI